MNTDLEIKSEHFEFKMKRARCSALYPKRFNKISIESIFKILRVKYQMNRQSSTAAITI